MMRLLLAEWALKMRLCSQNGRRGWGYARNMGAEDDAALQRQATVTEVTFRRLVAGRYR